MMQLADLREHFKALPLWDFERRPMAEEPDLQSDDVGLRPPSIEALETEIARARLLVDRISEELLETQAVLEATQQLAQVLGRMLDDARLAAAESPGCLALHDRAAQ